MVRAGADEIGSQAATSSAERRDLACVIARNAEAIATAFVISMGKPSQDKGFLRVAHPKGLFCNVPTRAATGSKKRKSWKRTPGGYPETTTGRAR